MTTLEAVNAILRAAGDSPVTALDPSGAAGTSDAAAVQASLEEWTRRGQEEQAWRFNFRDRVTLTVPDVRIVVTGGSGTFQYDELVTESVSGATGGFAYLETVGATTYMFLRRVTGTFTGGQTLTGSDSGATKTGGTYSAPTTAKIPEPKTSGGNGVIAMVAYQRSVSLQVAGTNRFVFDHDTPYEHSTGVGGLIWTRGGSLVADYILRYDFESIPVIVQQSIVDAAAMAYNADFGDPHREVILRARAGASRVRALQSEERAAAVNILTQSRHVRAVRGGGNRTPPSGEWFA